MATMGEYRAEAYVDNGEGVYVFQLDGNRVRWAAAYHGADGADMLVYEDPEDCGEFTAKRFVRSFLGE